MNDYLESNNTKSRLQHVIWPIYIILYIMYNNICSVRGGVCAA